MADKPTVSAGWARSCSRGSVPWPAHTSRSRSRPAGSRAAPTAHAAVRRRDGQGRDGEWAATRSVPLASNSARPSMAACVAAGADMVVAAGGPEACSRASMLSCGRGKCA